ncbi:MAG: transporter substrate-binding domain-containing protein [Christensenellaceae bacterium]|jgi:hypothetical protein|nr:transporter substrate-binding domain-containing protein [Christensenellaceae bacterium]MBS6563791.1 transporter substrate-binding domain-containing protein [Clostridiales bacterium]
MKKILLVLVCLVMSACMFAGCAQKDPDDANGGDKNGYSVGVQSGTTGQFYIEGSEDLEFDGFSNITLRKFNNAGLAVKDMLNGNLDAVVVDEGPAGELVKANKGVKLIDIRLTDEEYAFGVDKNNDELLNKVNEFITKAMSDGTIEGIMNKYFNEEGEITGIESAALDNSRADEQLVVATNAAFPPFEYTLGDKFAGIDMEIAAALADYLGMELVIQNMDFESVVTSVGKNGVDIAMAGLTVSEKRKLSVNFSESYYEASQMVLVLENDDTFDACKSAEDVENILKSK